MIHFGHVGGLLLLLLLLWWWWCVAGHDVDVFVAEGNGDKIGMAHEGNRAARRKSVGSCSGLSQEVFLSRRRTKQLFLLDSCCVLCERKGFSPCVWSWLVVNMREREQFGWRGAKRLRRNGKHRIWDDVTTKIDSCLRHQNHFPFIIFGPSHKRSLSSKISTIHNFVERSVCVDT